MFLGKPKWVYYFGVSSFCVLTVLILLLFTLPCVICFVKLIRNSKKNTVKFDSQTNKRGTGDEGNKDRGEIFKKKNKDRAPIVVDNIDTDPDI